MKRFLLPCLIVFMANISAQVGTGNVGINTETPEKALDVNGDLRTQKTDASTNTQYLLETNSISYPGYNFSGVLNPADGTGSIIGQSKNFTSFNQSDSNGSSGLTLISSLGINTAQFNSVNGNFYSTMDIGTGGYTMSTSNSSTQSLTSFIIPNSTTQSPNFRYQDDTGTLTGEYSFPRNYGLRGQVLVTHGKPTATGNAGIANDLVWRDVADLIVLKSPGGNCYKITVTDAGVLGTTPDVDCMVDPYNPTTYSNTSRTAAGSTNTLTDPNTIIAEQKKQIEEIQKQMNEIRNKLIQKKKTKSTK
ncbi:YckD family protein [Chryseobacterium oranimense]|uniref:YckD family protein n=1 Tax=Chryseobacterium oranimense TaxID=421058 RepID=UPI0021AF58CF|nr:YckD family protein [Chryseobacterium oranimense]UWX60079.1 YckD family protein [Chryseobacterium oranimense]